MITQKTVVLDGGIEIIIAKLPIGRYAELLAAIQELPKKFKGFTELKTEEIVAIIPQLIGECLPDVLRIIQVSTTLEMEQINALGLSEVVEILVTIFEVNNYQKVFEQIKKVVAHQQAVPEIKT